METVLLISLAVTKASVFLSLINCKTILRVLFEFSKENYLEYVKATLSNGTYRCYYHHLNSILAANQDQTFLENKKQKKKTEAPMGYLRGSSYYAGGVTND